MPRGDAKLLRISHQPKADSTLEQAESILRESFYAADRILKHVRHREKLQPGLSTISGPFPAPLPQSIQRGFQPVSNQRAARRP